MKFFLLVAFFMGAGRALRLGDKCHYVPRRLTCVGAPDPGDPVFDL